MSAVSVWRLCANKYAASAFNGEGARLFGGRWSPRGVAAVYTAESRALAMVEVLANVDERERLFDLAWVLIRADVAAAAIEQPKRFPETWRQYPRATATQDFGGKWAREGRTVALRVPSAIVPGEFNFLLNPLHPDFPQVKIGKPEPLAFDPRLAG